MDALSTQQFSAREYLERERIAFEKSEYYNGEIFAMSRVGRNHNLIVASLIGEIGAYLKGKHCTLFPGNQRVADKQGSFFTYPDVSVVSGKDYYLDDTFDTLLNPSILFEVLSSTTEDYDRGTKFKLYRSIPSLQNYVLVSSTEMLAEVYSRHGDTWVLTTAKAKEESIHISSINVNLLLADIYAQVDDLVQEA